MTSSEICMVCEWQALHDACYVCHGSVFTLRVLTCDGLGFVGDYAVSSLPRQQLVM